MNFEPFTGTAALARLPHGAEFRFIDKLLRLDPGMSGEGEYRVRGDEHFLKGHFPGEPIFPGVILVEAGAQLAGIIAQNDLKIAPLTSVKLTAIRSVKILATARPGQLIQIQSEINGRLGNLIQASIRAFCEGQLLMSGDITLSGESE